MPRLGGKPIERGSSSQLVVAEEVILYLQQGALALQQCDALEALNRVVAGLELCRRLRHIEDFTPAAGVRMLNSFRERQRVLLPFVA